MLAPHAFEAAPSAIGRAPICSAPGQVAVSPGQTELTRTDVPATSAASVRVSALSAALLMP
jgi:hypothetical protein